MADERKGPPEECPQCGHDLEYKIGPYGDLRFLCRNCGYSGVYRGP